MRSQSFFFQEVKDKSKKFMGKVFRRTSFDTSVIMALKWYDCKSQYYVFVSTQFDDHGMVVTGWKNRAP